MTKAAPQSTDPAPEQQANSRRPRRLTVVLVALGVVLALIVAAVVYLASTNQPGEDNPLRKEAFAIIESLGGTPKEIPGDDSQPYRIVADGGIEIATSRDAIDAEVARIDAVLEERGGWLDSVPPEVVDADIALHRSKIIGGRPAVVTLMAPVYPVEAGQGPSHVDWALTFTWA
ncbi:hypothetical protein [Parenemella sanctibonifatiensis]|uniref:Uncharacterized protein n=1 Tax=Parenemella sanctibonifatiensis TaxID=2016505 RepID=A0A255EE18_9ACTN|nr:hypothetical protein [Parenemella sanctibonifatiensis]OYN89786.1 hypothetical protein CGZ91_09730 [Parenemella sanctibonifatiensis]